MVEARIVIPDDAPAVLGSSEAYRSLNGRSVVTYYNSLPTSELELTERIQGFDAVINIRSSINFTEGVFSACPDLNIVSIWGTGTDHVDLDAAIRHGIPVTNTHG